MNLRLSSSEQGEPVPPPAPASGRESVPTMKPSWLAIAALIISLIGPTQNLVLGLMGQGTASERISNNITSLNAKIDAHSKDISDLKSNMMPPTVLLDFRNQLKDLADKQAASNQAILELKAQDSADKRNDERERELANRRADSTQAAISQLRDMMTRILLDRSGTNQKGSFEVQPNDYVGPRSSTEIMQINERKTDAHN